MNNGHLLLECIDCKETYLSDDKCDRYKCPECNGYIMVAGRINDMEDRIEELTDKMNGARANGLIRDMHDKKKLICGMDFGSGKDMSVRITIDTKEINETLKNFTEKLNKAINNSISMM